MRNAGRVLGIGTLTARIVECIILLEAVRRKTGFRSGTGLTAVVRRRILATAAPLVINELAWILSENTYAAIYGHMDTAALVSMTMTYPLQNLVMGLFTGLAAAATPLLGGSLGLGHRDTAQTDAIRLLRISLTAASVLAVTTAATAQLYTSVYNVPPDLRSSAVACLLVFSGYLVVKVQNKVIYDGILSSGGDTRYFLVTGTLTTWLVGVPAAFIAAFVLGWPVWGVYLILSLEEVIRLVIGLRRVHSTKWMRIDVANITGLPT